MTPSQVQGEIRSLCLRFADLIHDAERHGRTLTGIESVDLYIECLRTCESLAAEVLRFAEEDAGPGDRMDGDALALAVTGRLAGHLAITIDQKLNPE